MLRKNFQDTIEFRTKTKVGVGARVEMHALRWAEVLNAIEKLWRMGT